MNTKIKVRKLKSITTINQNIFTLEKHTYGDSRKNFPHWDIVIKLYYTSKHENDKVIENFGPNEKKARRYWENKVVSVFGNDEKKENDNGNKKPSS